MLNFLKHRTLSENKKSKYPKMLINSTGWEIELTLVKIFQEIIEGDFVSSEQRFSIRGVWQPLRDEQLELKPEGQRSWDWWQLHVSYGQPNIETGDRVLFNNRQYKVMQKKDYSLSNYIEYQLCSDYQNGSRK